MGRERKYTILAYHGGSSHYEKYVWMIFFGLGYGKYLVQRYQINQDKIILTCYHICGAKMRFEYSSEAEAMEAMDKIAPINSTPEIGRPVYGQKEIFHG